MPQGLQHKLRQLLDSPDFDTLTKVIEGKALEEEIVALEEAGLGGNFEKFTDSSLAHLKVASRYRIALEILKEVRTQQTHNLVTNIIAL